MPYRAELKRPDLKGERSLTRTSTVKSWLYALSQENTALITIAVTIPHEAVRLRSGFD